VSGPFSDLRAWHARVQPPGHAGVPEVVRLAGQRRCRLRRGECQESRRLQDTPQRRELIDAAVAGLGVVLRNCTPTSRELAARTYMPGPAWSRGARTTVFLGSQIVQLAVPASRPPNGAAARSAAPSLDPPTTHTGAAPTRMTGEDQDARFDQLLQVAVVAVSSAPEQPPVPSSARRWPTAGEDENLSALPACGGTA
jgi:hypothetical protein